MICTIKALQEAFEARVLLWVRFVMDRQSTKTVVPRFPVSCPVVFMAQKSCILLHVCTIIMRGLSRFLSNITSYHKAHGIFAACDINSQQRQR